MRRSVKDTMVEFRNGICDAFDGDEETIAEGRKI